jgi:hypothetical protein
VPLYHIIIYNWYSNNSTLSIIYHLSSIIIFLLF